MSKKLRPRHSSIVTEVSSVESVGWDFIVVRF